MLMLFLMLMLSMRFWLGFFLGVPRCALDAGRLIACADAGRFMRVARVPVFMKLKQRGRVCPVLEPLWSSTDKHFTPQLTYQHRRCRTCTDTQYMYTRSRTCAHKHTEQAHTEPQVHTQPYMHTQTHSDSRMCIHGVFTWHSCSYTHTHTQYIYTQPHVHHKATLCHTARLRQNHAVPQ